MLSANPEQSLRSLSDQTLLTDTANLVRVEKQTTLRVLEYLHEIDTRRLWLREGYSSLFDFCVRYLNYSEGEAARRIQSARCAARVEEVKPLLEKNELSLTGLSLIAPFVTKQNAETLLPQVLSKTTREIEEVLHREFPESRPSEEYLKIRLDDELKELFAQAQKQLSEKDQTVVLKRVLKGFVTKRIAKRTERTMSPRKHTRYVPRAVRKEVQETSAHQCTYQAPSGVRCNQTAHLQVDHVRPWAKGGSSWDPSNLRLLCRAHNLMLGNLAFPRHRAKDVLVQAWSKARDARTVL